MEYLHGSARHGSCECPYEMDLLERHKKFLIAALSAAWKENKAFSVREVGSWLKIGDAESDEIVRALEKADLIRSLPNSEAMFTTAGRERAEALKAVGASGTARWSGSEPDGEQRSAF
jgi:hypothetical protein